jgi:hypothetical protein
VTVEGASGDRADHSEPPFLDRKERGRHFSLERPGDGSRPLLRAVFDLASHGLRLFLD